MKVAWPLMQNEAVVMLWLVNFYQIYGANSCETYVCLKWKVTLNELRLTCKVTKLHFKVWILDQFGNVQASCIPSTPLNKCETYYRNGTISQNSQTNETIFTVSGYIDYHINGNWTCRHGRRRDVAQVEVTVLRIQEQYNNTNNNIKCKPNMLDKSCITHVLLTATLSVLGSIILSLILLPFFKTTSFRLIDEFCIKLHKCEDTYINISTKILVCKRIAFALLTMLFLSVAVLFGLFDNTNCASKWMFICFGLAFGIIVSLLFLTNADQNVNITSRNIEMGDVIEEEGSALNNM